MRRRSALALLFALSACTSPSKVQELFVEVDADEAVLTRLRDLSISIYDGDEKIDGTDPIQPTSERPFCLPLSLGIVPEAGHGALEAGVAVDATFKHGGAIHRRVDTGFTEGARLIPILLDASCLQPAGCDRREHIAPEELQAFELGALEQRVAQTECRPFVGAAECINRGGCFETGDNFANCKLPCNAKLSPIAAPMDPHPPVPPSRPELTPCEPGWSELPPSTPDGVTTCEPWPAGAREDCPLGEARFPGEPACAPLGSSCPSGDWPDNLPGGSPLRFVHPNAMPGGDGSMAAPHATIAEALGAAVDGTVIVLSKGVHSTAPLAIRRPLSILGACAAATSIQGTRGDALALLSIASAGVSMASVNIQEASIAISVDAGSLALSGVEVSATSGAGLIMSANGSARATRLRLVDNDGGGINAGAGGTITATAVEITGAAGAALLVSGAGSSVELSSATFADVRPTARYGYAVRVENGGRAAIQRAVAENAAGHAISADGAGSYLALRRSLVRDTASNTSLREGEGLRLENGASGVLERVAIERARNAGTYTNSGSSFIARDLLVRDVRPQESDHAWASGMICSSRCQLDGLRVWIERARHHGLEIGSNGGCKARVLDLTVRETDSSINDERRGWGLVLFDDGDAHVERALLEKNRGAGVMMDTESKLQLFDAIIRGTTPDASHAGGFGIDQPAGSRLELARAVIAQNAFVGIRIGTNTATAATTILEDVEVNETQPTGDTDGVGISLGAPQEVFSALPPATFRMSRARLLGNHAAAISLNQARATLEDIVVRDTVAPAGNLAGGNALFASAGTEIHAARLVLDRNTDAAVLAAGPQCSMFFEDLVVTDTGCPADQQSCGAYHGAGIAIVFDGYVEAKRFKLDGNRQNGFQLDFVGRGRLEDGEIAHSATGAYARAGDFDVQQLAIDVDYHDNGSNIVAGDPPP